MKETRKIRGSSTGKSSAKSSHKQIASGKTSPLNNPVNETQLADKTFSSMLESLKPHDHLCLIYETHDEWRNAVIPFITLGLKRNEKCIYVVDASTADEIRHYLAQEGTDVESAEKSGRLTILSSSDAYTREGSFDPDRMIALLIAETNKAVAEGYSALRVTGEMTWVLKGHPGSEKLLEYEAKLNSDFFPKYPCLAICQYHRWKFDPELIKGIVMTHPYLIKNNEIYHNFYYIPPQEFLNQKRAELEVQHWLNNLQREQLIQHKLQESLEHYRTLAEQSLIAIVVLQGFRIVYANPAFAEITGYSIEEALSLPPEKVQALVYPEDQSLVWGRFRDRLEGKEVPSQYQYRGIRKDGSIRWLEMNASRIIFNGKPAVQAIINDITERKELEQVLEAELFQMLSILNGINAAAYVTDPFTHEILFANQYLKTILGNDPTGRKCYKEFQNLEQPCDFCTNEIIIKQKYKTYQWEYHNPKLNRDYILYDRIIKWSDGRDVRFELGIDITERKQIETALNHLNLNLRSIRDINQLIIVEKDRDRLLHGICQCLVENKSYQGAWIILLDGSQRLTAYAQAGFDSNFEKLVGQINQDKLPYCARQALQNPGVVVIEENKADCFNCPLYRKTINRTALSVRLQYNNKICGVLFALIPKQFASEEELSLFQEVAIDCAFALNNIEMESRHRADEEALKQSEEKYRILVESANEGISIVQDRKIVFANQKVIETAGYSLEELNSMQIENLIHPEDRDRLMAYYARRMRGEEAPASYTFRLIDKHGNIKWIFRTVTVINWEGKPASLVMDTDITERMLAEESKKQLEQKAQIASRLASIGEMAAGIAHEINNPLTGVIGYAQLLMERSDLSDEIRKDLMAINDGAQHAASIVRRLLMFARQIKPEKRMVNINELIENTLAFRAYQLKVNNIEVALNLARDIPLTVADPGQIQQVLLNLIVNAEIEMKKAHNGGKLTITTEKTDNIIKICIIDDGPGIKPEIIDKIFNPFFTTRQVGEGTGLGLSLCHGIIAEHNGRIYAESEYGKGATFIVELPIVSDVEYMEKTQQEEAQIPKATRARILVIDDEKLIHDFIRRVLTGEGYEVDITDNSSDALQKIQTHRYNLILLDVKMPGMDGIELYNQVKQIAESLAKRIIFITGDVMSAATEKFLTETRVAHIDKPFDAEQLKREVNKALTKL